MTAFKIGSVYRDQSGRLQMLLGENRRGDPMEDGVAWVKVWDEKYGAWLADGNRDLKTGEDLINLRLPEGGFRHLVPGELHKVGDEWVPVARGVEESQPKTAREILDTYYRGLIGNVRLTGGLSSRDVKERVRPRLTWADTKPVDRWDGFTVYSETTEHPSHSHPTQKMQEGRNPVNGSAALLKVR